MIYTARRNTTPQGGGVSTERQRLIIKENSWNYRPKGPPPEDVTTSLAVQFNHLWAERTIFESSTAEVATLITMEMAADIYL